MTWRKRKSTKKASTPKKRRKSIALNPDFWVRNTKDVTEWRELNLPEDGLCPILKTKPRIWTLDHDHFSLHCRSVISGVGNIFEGRVTKDFQKYVANHTDLSLSEVLRNLADYLEQPYWLYNKLHHRGVEDMRKHLERCTKETIQRKLREDFNIELLDISETLKEDLIILYLENFIRQYEENIWKP